MNWLLFFALAFSSEAMAKGLRQAHDINVEFKSDILLGAFTEQNSESLSNPSNRVLYLPSDSFATELKPTLKINGFHNKLKLISIPRVQFHVTKYDFGSTSETRNLLDYGFWETYAAVNPAANLTLSAGIINSQWGPSDLLSPSQFLFPELLIKPEPFQSTQGTEMASVQWTPTQSLTLTLMGELAPFNWEHTDTPPERERTFQHRALVRGEYSSDSGSFTLGLVAGRKETDRARAQLGSYAMWNYTNSTQIFYDVGAQKGSEATSPLSDSNFSYVGLIGHRFTLTNGIEWRIEFIGNDNGLSEDERKAAYQKLRANPSALQYLAILNNQNSALPGTQFLANSFRWDNVPLLERVFTNTHVYLRSIFSLADNSQLLNVGIEGGLTNNLSNSVAFLGSIGDDESELGSSLQSYFSYFLKFSF